MTVRIGFFGAGLISRLHRALLAHSSVDHQIVAIHDPDTGRAARFADETGARVFADEGELIESVDAVYVTTWTSEHSRLVEAAAARGVAVFCEKPLAVNADTAGVMVEAVEKFGVTNQVGLILRSIPTVVLARRLVKDSRAGKLLAVAYRDEQYIPNQGMYASTWRTDPNLSGRGTLLEHSIHDVDILRWMCGPIDTVSATVREQHGYERIDDVAVARLEFAGGGIAALTSVWHDMLERPSLRRIEVYCERLYLSIDDGEPGVLRWQFAGEEPESLAGADLADECQRGEDSPLGSLVSLGGHAFFNSAEVFLESVRDGNPSPLPLREAMDAHRIVDALYRSADNGGIPISDIESSHILAPAGVKR